MSTLAVLKGTKAVLGNKKLESISDTAIGNFILVLNEISHWWDIELPTVHVEARDLFIALSSVQSKSDHYV